MCKTEDYPLIYQWNHGSWAKLPLRAKQTVQYKQPFPIYSS